MINPCKKDCPERASDCHISCERYKEYREYLDEKNTLKRKENDATAYLRIKNSKFRIYYDKRKARHDKY